MTQGPASEAFDAITALLNITPRTNANNAAWERAFAAARGLIPLMQNERQH
jgi:hypothetical protein